LHYPIATFLFWRVDENNVSWDASGQSYFQSGTKNWTRWRLNRNRLLNLHLLEGRSNGSKSDMRLIDYYTDMNTGQKVRFYETAIIPKDVSLDIEKFYEFYETRRKLLANKIKALLG